MTRSITGWLITLALAALAVATAAPQALAFTLGDAIYDCDYLSEAVYLGGGQLSPDGTKLYILTGSAPATIRYYTLATPWDLTTASYVATKTFTISGSNPPYGAYGHNLHISPDGTRLYFVIDWPGMTTSVVQHNFGTAWDVSTLSSTPSGQKTIGYTIPGGLEFSADGTKMYVSEIQNMSRPIYQWTLSTPWSVSSASASGYSFNIGGEAAGNLFWGALDFWFSSDGATMCAIGKHPNGSSTLQIKKYTLITPWRVSTASYASDSFSPSAQVNHSYTTDLIIGDSDTKLYLVSTAAPYGTLQYSLDGSGGRSPCPWSATTNAAGTVVTITFSRAMADPAGMHDQFSYKINGGGAQTFSAAALNADTKKIELTCSGTPIAYGNTVTVSYTAGTVAAADTVALDSFSDFAVTNAMPAPPTFSSATTNTAGSVITITFSKAMANPAGKHDQFTYQIDGGATQAFSAAALNATTTKIDLTCAGTAIAAGNTVTVNYTAGTVVAADGGVLATFSGQAVSNIVPDPALTVVSAETNTAGNGIVVTFSRAMANPSGKHGQFVYKINGGSNQSFSAAALNADPTKINLTCSGTTIVYGNTVTLNYTQGTVVAADGLYLGSFTDQAVTNNVPQTYAVTYNGNGNTGGSAPSSQTKVHDVPLTLRTNTGSLVKTGSTFTGWNTQADGLGTHYDAGGTYTANAAVTMYAEWTLNTWPVTYDANGATAGTAPDAQTKVYNVALTLRTNTGGLEKTGYTLSGWNTAANGSGTNYAEGASYTTNAALSLYAKWTANDYMVFFDAAGGTYPTPASKIVTFGSLYGTLATTSLAGYTLDGWFTEPTGGDEITAESIVAVAADDTLYAQWTANEYTVTFEAMDGTTPVPQTKQVTYGQAYGALATTDREGYVFDGWFTAPGGGDQVTAESIVTVAADDTLYAQWTANDYMVFFDAAGGTNPTPASKIVTFGALYGTLATTSRTGYALAGWFDGPERGEVTAETVVTTAGDHTLYAHWTPNEYTVTFDAQGGTEPDPTSTQVTYGAVYGALATTSRTGYAFVGWFDESIGGNEVTAGTIVATAQNHTLYAQWEPNTYTVTFDAEGGSDPDPETKQVIFGQQYGRLAATSRTGYEFVGWFTGGPERDEITSESIVTIAGDHTLYAQWTANEYTVTFDSQGGSDPDPAAKRVTFGQEYGDLATTSRTGYWFGGWYTDPEGGTEVQPITIVEVAADDTLYARWTAEEYKVTFDAQGGSTPDPEYIVVIFDQPYGTLATTEREGSEFAGWFTAPQGGTEVTAESIVTIASSHTLHARWAANEFTVTFDAQGGTEPDPVNKVVVLGLLYGELARTERQGYLFAGWFTEPGDGVQSTGGDLVTDETEVTTAADHTLYAHWGVETYAVTYDGNGHAAGTVPASQSAVSGVYLTLARNIGGLTREGFRFAGWNTAADGSGADYAEGAQYTEGASATMYAKWTPYFPMPAYTVSYDGNGNTSGTAPESQHKAHGVPLTLATNCHFLSRTGYLFVGWNTEPNGTGTPYAAGGTYTVDADATLYAWWTLAGMGAVWATENPVLSRTTINYSLSEPARVGLSIYSVTGRELLVVDLGEQGSGAHSVEWDGRDASGARVASGVYFARVSTATERQEVRLIVLR